MNVTEQRFLSALSRRLFLYERAIRDVERTYERMARKKAGCDWNDAEARAKRVADDPMLFDENGDFRGFEDKLTSRFVKASLIFFELAPYLDTMAEVKILSHIIRQTYGWKDDKSGFGYKRSDEISYSQFLKATGVESQAARAATMSLAAKGFIHIDKGDNWRDTNRYNVVYQSKSKQRKEF